MSDHDRLRQSLGQRLSIAREQAELNQDKAAGWGGTNKYMVLKWELDRSAPPDEMLARLADLYQVSVDWLDGTTDFQDATSELPFQASYDEGEYEHIRQGLEPQRMENKRAIFVDGDVAHFHRSWTRHCMFQVSFERRESRFVVTTAIGERLSRGDGRYEAELLHFPIDNLLLGKSKAFPKPAGLLEEGKSRGVYQHHIAGTGYPEREVPIGNEPDESPM